MKIASITLKDEPDKSFYMLVKRTNGVTKRKYLLEFVKKVTICQ